MSIACWPLPIWGLAFICGQHRRWEELFSLRNFSPWAAPELHGALASTFAGIDEGPSQGMWCWEFGRPNVTVVILTMQHGSFTLGIIPININHKTCGSLVHMHISPTQSRGQSSSLGALGQVFLTYWWMQHFGGLTAKRHLGLSNAPTVGRLDFGKLCKDVLRRLSKSSAKSAVAYKSKSGRTSFKGSKFLKSTGSDS